jgi:thiamine pyrophosphate-dependent acetolactate synthase large subunit-like protein
MAGRTGRSAILEQFLADGMDHMFGNPGTVEQGFLDSLAAYPQMHYVLTLQESVTVLAADGYARATRKPTLVQLHSSPGIGNAVGALYQAKRGHAPLVVIGGDAGIRYMNMDAQMANDLVAMMAPVTKYATMVYDSESLLRTVRRCIKIAATPPMGPVYVCLPADILDKPCTEPVVRTSIPSTRVVPDDEFVKQAAIALCAAARPMMFIGDGVAYSGAQAEVEAVAELLGAEVWGVDSGELNMRYDHPLYQGQTGHMFGFASHPITSKGDVNLVCGTYMVPEVFPRLDTIFAPGAKVIHVDLNAYEIAKNHPVDMGVVADPKLTLAKMAEVLRGTMTDAQRAAAKERATATGRQKENAQKALREKDAAGMKDIPMHPAAFMAQLGARAPKDVVVFDEGLTSSPEITRYLTPTRADHFFQTRGGSLGVGIPGAIGLKLAFPKKTVIGFTGDGGSMYTIQALWTAAHHRIGSKFVICNNQTYMLLKLNILQYWKELGIDEHAFPDGFNLKNPVVDFVKIAESMGVPGVRVERPDQIAGAIDAMLAADGPFLVDLVVTDCVPGSKMNCKCGQ